MRSGVDKVFKSGGHYEGDLVSLDFKSQSLNKFLENVVQLVNQHSHKINLLEMDKITIDRVRNGNQKLVAAQRLPQNVLNTIPKLREPSKVETYEDTIQGMSNNMKLCTHSIQYLYEELNKKDERINTMDSQLGNFIKTEQVRSNVRTAVQTCQKFTTDENNKILNRLKQLEIKTNKKIAEFQNLTKETQKKTLWKINECESILLKKVTPDYVEKAIEQLESKIHNDIKNNRNQEINEVKFNVQTLKSKLDGLNRDVQGYERENKEMLKKLEEEIKTLEKIESTEKEKRNTDMRIKELLIKIDRLEKREDPMDTEMRLGALLSEQKEKLAQQTEKLKKVEQGFDSMNNVMSSISMEGGGMDPHKLCQIDGEVRRLRDSNRTNETKLQSLEDEVKNKLLMFQERIMTTLGMLKGQDNFVNREQLYESLSRLREPVTERMNENQNLIHELNGKITKFELFERATKRKIKQMTRGDELNKILDMKMGVEQAETSFSALNMKLENLEIIFNKMKMEVEENNQFLDYLHKEINDTEEGINIIGPKSKVFPAKCLGCGYKHNPVHDNNMMMGADGKYYKVDLGNYSVRDQREVYAVTPSQITVYEHSLGMTAKKATRPTSSKTVIRPNSANKYRQ